MGWGCGTKRPRPRYLVPTSQPPGNPRLAARAGCDAHASRKMAPGTSGAVCQVYGCGSRSSTDKDRIFHRFPSDERYQSWVEACGRPELFRKSLEQVKNLRICSLHFSKRFYKTEKTLNPAAVPTINLPPPLPTKTTLSVGTQTTNDFTLNPAAIPTIDLPSPIPTKTSLSVGTQTTCNLIQDSTIQGVSRGVQASIRVKVNTSTNLIDRSVQTCTNNLTDRTQRKRKLKFRKRLKILSKNNIKIMLSSSTPLSHRQFEQACDEYLSPNLSKTVKLQAKLKPKMLVIP